MTRSELLAWIEYGVPPDAREAILRLVGDIENATKENIRLHSIIKTHTLRLSSPIVQNYSAEVKIEVDSEKCFRTTAFIRLQPIQIEIKVPVVGSTDIIGKWSHEYKIHFFDQVVEGFSHIAAQRVSNLLWPKMPKEAP